MNLHSLVVDSPVVWSLGLLIHLISACTFHDLSRLVSTVLFPPARSGACLISLIACPRAAATAAVAANNAIRPSLLYTRLDSTSAACCTCWHLPAFCCSCCCCDPPIVTVSSPRRVPPAAPTGISPRVVVSAAVVAPVAIAIRQSLLYSPRQSPSAASTGTSLCVVASAVAVAPVATSIAIRPSLLCTRLDNCRLLAPALHAAAAAAASTFHNSSSVVEHQLAHFPYIHTPFAPRAAPGSV
mmetsp:Transcript_21861/g.35421  ORF Transcript_21861/g.35421 Transcript_21861/m.35421 type:complete len:241 (+) Transcript_21861:199-921(+)